MASVVPRRHAAWAQPTKKNNLYINLSYLPFPFLFLAFFAPLPTAVLLRSVPNRCSALLLRRRLPPPDLAFLGPPRLSCSPGLRARSRPGGMRGGRFAALPFGILPLCFPAVWVSRLWFPPIALPRCCGRTWFVCTFFSCIRLHVSCQFIYVFSAMCCCRSICALLLLLRLLKLCALFMCLPCAGSSYVYFVFLYNCPGNRILSSCLLPVADSCYVYFVHRCVIRCKPAESTI